MAAIQSEVSVVVTTFNHAQFLGDALDSIVRQTLPAGQLIVVDDGSQDDPASVVCSYPAAVLLRTENQGLSAARNAGLSLVTSRFVLFLDADDCLANDAIETGLACMQANPGAGFVYGAYRLVDQDLKPLSDPVITRTGPRSYHALLRQNIVMMHGAVLYDRLKLLECGGFEPELQCCEDYDVYLRMTKRYRAASHTDLVALYRMHGLNMSRDTIELNFWRGKVRDRNRPPAEDAEALKAWQEGGSKESRTFANHAWKHLDVERRSNWGQRFVLFRRAPVASIAAILRNVVIRSLPRPLADWMRRAKRRLFWPGPKVVDFGDLLRINPVARNWGFARGTPVDRVYIEQFFERHRTEIAGRVLETGDTRYSDRFGSAVTQQDVLDIQDGAAGTTIVGDLGKEDALPPQTFDCIILAQTLQYVDDLKAAARQLHLALRPGGVVLATLPCIGPLFEMDNYSWKWLFTPRLARELFAAEFGEDNVDIGIFGNAFAATCFLQGIAAEEVGADWLEPVDTDYPLIITVRARRTP